ncbi:hypothetical protein KCU85_g340, partial [Aureobasidium melanogenum]
MCEPSLARESATYACPFSKTLPRSTLTLSSVSSCAVRKSKANHGPDLCGTTKQVVHKAFTGSLLLVTATYGVFVFESSTLSSHECLFVVIVRVKLSLVHETNDLS